MVLAGAKKAKETIKISRINVQKARGGGTSVMANHPVVQLDITLHLGLRVMMELGVSC